MTARESWRKGERWRRLEKVKTRRKSEKEGDREDKPERGDGGMKVETPPSPIIRRGPGSPEEVSQEVRDPSGAARPPPQERGPIVGGGGKADGRVALHVELLQS